MRHLPFSDVDKLSSRAKEARMVSISSPSPLMEWMFSRSKYASTPSSCSLRTVSKSVTENKQPLCPANKEAVICFFASPLFCRRNRFYPFYAACFMIEA